MRSFEEHVRDGVRRLHPYQAGRPIEEVQRELGLARVVKLASNEYPEGPFPEVFEALQKELAELHRYPDPSWYGLLDAVEEIYGLRRDEILFGNGANEVLELLVHMLCGPGDEILFAHPSFPIYALLARSHFEGGRSVPLDENHVHDLPRMAKALTPRTRLVFLCNPNNPTGTWFGSDALEAFLEQVPPDVIVALDEAYAEFVVAEDYPDWFTLRERWPNLLSIRSFSKIYSLAALRIGYVMGHRDIIAMLQRVRQPFNVNRLAQCAAAAALRQQHRVAERRALNRRRLEFVTAGLQRLGVSVLPSQTNFVLVLAPQAGADVADRLLREGVIVRPMQRWGLDEGSFRVNVGLEEENEMLLKAVGKVLSVGGAV